MSRAGFLFWVLGWLLLVGILPAQQSRIDSLQQVIETAKVDTIRGRSLCRLCEALCLANQYESALETGKRGLALCRQAGDLQGEADCLNSLGMAYSRQGQVATALEQLQRSLSIHEQLRDQLGMAISLNNLGTVLFGQGRYDQSLAHYLRSLSLFESLGRRDMVATLYNNVGNIYLSQDNRPEALNYYHRSLHIREALGDTEGVANCLFNIGVIHIQERNFELALEVNERSLRIWEEKGDRLKAARLLNNLGNLFDKWGQGDRALASYHRSLWLLTALGDRIASSNLYINLGTLYLGQGQLDSARFYVEKGYEAARQLGLLKSKKTAMHALYRLDSAAGDWKSAFEAHRLFLLYSDSLRNDELSRNLGRLEAQYESEKAIAQRDLAITRLEADRLRKDLVLTQARSKYVQDSLANAEQQAHLQAQSLLLTQQVKERDGLRLRDSLENASRFERLERERVQRQAQLELQRVILVSAAVGLMLVLLIAYLLFLSRRRAQRANEHLWQLNEAIQHQKGEIEQINVELQDALVEVKEQKIKIEDSIHYASRIQYAILPAAAHLQEHLPPHFICYQPRDIVSGDFYWLAHLQGKTLFAVADCTGHGVPGAFMSVLGSNLLHQIVEAYGLVEPGAIFSMLDNLIAAALHQQLGGESKDGIDLALVVLHEADASGGRVIDYAGAGRPLWHVSQSLTREYKSGKYPCGGSQHEAKQFPSVRIEARPGDRMYFFSDGAIDQFGGPKGRKLGSAQLQAFFQDTSVLRIEEQGRAFEHFFAAWMQGRKQLDDVLVVGLAMQAADN